MKYYHSKTTVLHLLCDNEVASSALSVLYLLTQLANAEKIVEHFTRVSVIY